PQPPVLTRRRRSARRLLEHEPTAAASSAGTESAAQGDYGTSLTGKSFLSAPSVPDPVDVDEEAARAAEDLVAAIRRRVLDEPWVLHAAEELADRELGLQPGERGAEAVVDALAVADVLVVRAFEVESVGVLEPFRVTVRRPVTQEDRRARRDGGAGDLDVLEGRAGGPELDRRLKAQQLLDPGHDQLRSAAQLLELVGVPQQGQHAVRDQVDRGLMPGEEHEQRVVDDRLLGQAPLRAVVVDHSREHARSGLLAVLVDQVGQELLEL